MGNSHRAEREGNGQFSLFYHVPYGVCIVKPDFTVAFWNTVLAHWTGIPAGEALDRAASALLPELEKSGFRDEVERALQGDAAVPTGNEAHPQLLSLPAASGESRLHAVRASTLPGPAEHLALLTVEHLPGETAPSRASQEAHDLARVETERRRQLEREQARMVEYLRLSQRIKGLGVVARGIAHDFNNLLSVVMGNTDIIAAESNAQPLVAHCCGEIQKAAARSSELAAQLLAYSGGGALVVEELDLSGLVEESKPLIEAVPDARVRIAYALMPEIPAVPGDAAQLQLVLANLVAGASDALGTASGEVCVETGVVEADEGYLRSFCFDGSLSPGAYVYLEVRDNAPGLTQEVVDALRRQSRAAGLGDRGLGLAAALDVARAHHGGVRVLSIPGQGTSVRLHFPAIRDDVYSAVEEERVGGLLDAQPGSQRILLVDDEEMVRALGEVILEQNGYSVVTAKDGDEAIAMYEAYADQLSLVLLDTSMPRRDGYEAAKVMRGIRADIPIVLCSGYAGVDARNRFATLHVDGFLQKPYHLNELLETVRTTLARYEL